MPNSMDVEKIENELKLIQQRARDAAAEQLMLFWPRDELPRRGKDGVWRHGYGRAIERSPQREEVSRMALQMDLEHVSSILEKRVFELYIQASNRGLECADKVALLYSVADILGAEFVRDMDEVWSAANAGRWDMVSLHLGVLHWSAVDKEDVTRRMAAMEFVFKLRD